MVLPNECFFCSEFYDVGKSTATQKEIYCSKEHEQLDTSTQPQPNPVTEAEIAVLEKAATPVKSPRFPIVMKEKE